MQGRQICKAIQRNSCSRPRTAIMRPTTARRYANVGTRTPLYNALQKNNRSFCKIQGYRSMSSKPSRPSLMRTHLSGQNVAASTKSVIAVRPVFIPQKISFHRPKALTLNPILRLQPIHFINSRLFSQVANVSESPSSSSQIEPQKRIPYSLENPQTWAPLGSSREDIRNFWDPNSVATKIRLPDGGWVRDDGANVLTDQSPGAVNPGSGREPIELIAEIPPIEIETRTTVCDGGKGALGHPRVFINVDKGVTPCDYCGLRFVRKSSGSEDHH